MLVSAPCTGAVLWLNGVHACNLPAQAQRALPGRGCDRAGAAGRLRGRAVLELAAHVPVRRRGGEAGGRRAALGALRCAKVPHNTCSCSMTVRYWTISGLSTCMEAWGVSRACPALAHPASQAMQGCLSRSGGSSQDYVHLPAPGGGGRRAVLSRVLLPPVRRPRTQEQPHALPVRMHICVHALRWLPPALFDSMLAEQPAPLWAC